MSKRNPNRRFRRLKTRSEGVSEGRAEGVSMRLFSVRVRVRMRMRVRVRARARVRMRERVRMRSSVESH